MGVGGDSCWPAVKPCRRACAVDRTIDFGCKKEGVRRGILDFGNLHLTIPDELVYLGVSE